MWSKSAKLCKSILCFGVFLEVQDTACLAHFWSNDAKSRAARADSKPKRVEIAERCRNWKLRNCFWRRSVGPAYHEASPKKDEGHGMHIPLHQHWEADSRMYVFHYASHCFTILIDALPAKTYKIMYLCQDHVPMQETSTTNLLYPVFQFENAWLHLRNTTCYQWHAMLDSLYGNLLGGSLRFPEAQRSLDVGRSLISTYYKHIQTR